MLFSIRSTMSGRWRAGWLGALTDSVGWSPRGNGHAAAPLRDRSQTWVPPDLHPGNEASDAGSVGACP